jgi:hypothetical protein
MARIRKIANHIGQPSPATPSFGPTEDPIEPNDPITLFVALLVPLTMRCKVFGGLVEKICGVVSLLILIYNICKTNIL